jgi:predicted transcriptional regulator
MWKGIVMAAKKKPQHHSAVEHDVELDRLTRLLSRGWFTIARIAERMDCSKVTAHRRVRALKKRRKLVTQKMREGAAGPLSISYRLARRV